MTQLVVIEVSGLAGTWMSDGAAGRPRHRSNPTFSVTSLNQAIRRGTLEDRDGSSNRAGPGFGNFGTQTDSIRESPAPL
ncbi:MAG: hypothetical protein MJE77_21355 [Proteobacteria bacterium]|nr:hypothetical protein [Pseudomonadota bacterium]